MGNMPYFFLQKREKKKKPKKTKTTLDQCTLYTIFWLC